MYRAENGSTRQNHIAQNISCYHLLKEAYLTLNTSKCSAEE